METKQIIHIASEIVVIVALTVYFTQKNKRLSKHIQELAQRLEEQEDIIQRHEQVIRKMVNLINSMGPKHPQTQNPQPKNHVKPSYTKRFNKHPSPTGLPSAQITIHTQGPSEPRHGPGFNPLAAIFGARPPPRPSAHVDIEEVSDSESESSVSESESEEKLDADLEDELEELTEAAGESDLKSHEQENKKENGNE